MTKEQRHLRGDRGLQAFAKTQSKEMKTSIEQARRAATAMESSEGSLEVAKSSLRDTKRAFVYLKDFNMRLDRSVQLGTYGGEVPGPVHGLSLAPIWANSGKTPARRGSLSKRLQPGFAARGAVEAVLLALAGISGAKDVLEGTFGFYPLYEARESDIAAVIDGLGRHFLGGQASMKPYPCCRFCHAAIDAALASAVEADIAPDQIADAAMSGVPTHLATNPSIIVLPPRWKLLGPFEAVSGMLMFGLTTAFIFAVIQRLIHARFDGEDNFLL